MKKDLTTRNLNRRDAEAQSREEKRNNDKKIDLISMCGIYVHR
jgi:hypothetical protein